MEDAGCRLGTGSNGTVAGIMVKFATLGDFAMIAKITVHSENFNFRYAFILRYDSEFSLS